jgi:uncharacterized membrane protein
MTASVILCDYAQVWQGKLFISGAGVNLVGMPPEPPHQLSIHVGVILTVPWNAHNQLHKMTVSLLGQDEQLIPLGNLIAVPNANPADAGRIVAQFNAGRAPHMTSGDESILPIAAHILAQLPGLDTYHLVAAVDGTELARGNFRAMAAPQLQLPTM